MSDIDRALAMFAALGEGVDYDSLTYLIVPGAPANKVRPKFTRRGHAYMPKESRDAEKHTRSYMQREFPQPITGNVAMGCIFFRPNRQRIDTDNMLKHVCDSANGVIWNDDSQVTGLMAFTELDPDEPRTVIIVGPHTSSLARGSDATRDCVVCGTPFSIIGVNPKKKTCSRNCATAVRGYVPLDALVPCQQCGKPFRRLSQYRRLCSPECRAAKITGVRKANASPNSRCADCGAQLAHKRGGRCRDCWRASLRKGKSS